MTLVPKLDRNMAHKITLEQLHMIISGSFIRDEDDCDTWHDLELDVAKSLELGDMTKDDDPRVGQEIVEKLNEISKLMHELDVKFHDAYDCR